ncbi:MAG: hypothetical protein IKN12_13240 [Selenomonadaceae bacterium]|nr:hypothetical protein [Selenomonadaceae bacterium]
MKKEHGFMIVETLLLSFIAVGLSAAIYSYGAAIRAEETVKARTTALYLAKEEMAYIIQKRDLGELSEGNYKFLGERDLTLNNIRYEVFADVEEYEGDENFFKAKVTAKWMIFRKSRELSLERIMLNRKPD